MEESTFECRRMYLSVSCPDWEDGEDSEDEVDGMGDNSAVLGRSLSQAEKTVAAAVRGYSSELWAYANHLEVPHCWVPSPLHCPLGQVRLSFGQHMPIRVFVRGTPWRLDVTAIAYHEVRHPTTGVLQLRRLPNPDDGSLAEDDGVEVDAPLQQPAGVTVRRHAAERLDVMPSGRNVDDNRWSFRLPMCMISWSCSSRPYVRSGGGKRAVTKHVLSFPRLSVLSRWRS